MHQYFAGSKNVITFDNEDYDVYTVKKYIQNQLKLFEILHTSLCTI